MSRTHVEKLQQRFARLDAEAVDQAFSQMLSTTEGRKALWWLLQIGRFNTQPFTSNALTTAFGCGEMNVGQQVLQRIMDVEPAGFVRMMEENARERSSRDTQLGAALRRGTGGDDRGTDSDDGAGGDGTDSGTDED